MDTVERFHFKWVFVSWQHKKNLADIFDGFTKKQTEDLWAGLNQMCANTLLTLDLTQDDRLEGVCIMGIYPL